MKICHLHSGGWLNQLDDALRALGHEVTDYCDETTEVLFSNSVSQIERTFQALRAAPQAFFVSYNWDVYEWVWTNPRKGEYNYKLYGELLKRSDLVLCPSQCTVERTKQWYGIDAKVVKTYVPFYEAKPEDGNYLLSSLRLIPDRNLGWFPQACTELNIPFISNEHHRYPWDEWRSIIAHATALVSSYYELSTGGLDVIQGYYLGKPILLSDSPWHGGKDYLGDRAYYFKYDSYKDFKKALKWLWKNRPAPRMDHKEFVKENYSVEVMAKQIHDELCALTTKRDLSNGK